MLVYYRAYIYRRQGLHWQIRPTRKYLQDWRWLDLHTHERVPFFLYTIPFLFGLPSCVLTVDTTQLWSLRIVTAHHPFCEKYVLWSAIGLDNSLRISQRALSEDPAGTTTVTPECYVHGVHLFWKQVMLQLCKKQLTWISTYYYWTNHDALRTVVSK